MLDETINTYQLSLTSDCVSHGILGMGSKQTKSIAVVLKLFLRVAKSRKFKFLPAPPRSCAGAGQLEQIQDLLLLLLLILLLLHKHLSNIITKYITDSSEQNGLIKNFRQA